MFRSGSVCDSSAPRSRRGSCRTQSKREDTPETPGSHTGEEEEPKTEEPVDGGKEPEKKRKCVRFEESEVEVKAKEEDKAEEASDATVSSAPVKRDLTLDDFKNADHDPVTPSVDEEEKEEGEVNTRVLTREPSRVGSSCIAKNNNSHPADVVDEVDARSVSAGSY